MKHLLSLLTLVSCCILMVSCNNNDLSKNAVNESNKEYSTLNFRLDSLNQAYGIKNNIRYKPLEDAAEQEDTQELKEDKIEVVKADGEGFAIGASCSAVFGGAIGAIATGGSVVGGAIGTAIGWATGGVIGAVVASVLEVEEQEHGQMEYNDELGWYSTLSQTKKFYAIDLRYPIKSYLHQSCLFNEGIIGANVGFVHNYIISSLFHNNGSEMFLWSPEELMDSVVYSYADMLISDDLSIYDIFTIEDDLLRSIIAKDFPFDDEYFSYFVDSYCALKNEGNNFYILRDYTEEYMDIVQQELNDEKLTIFVNGAISTYFYSDDLWQTYMPTMKSYMYVYNDGVDGLSLIYGVEAYDYIITMLCAGSVSFVGVPNIRDNKIESIFVFDDLLPLGDVVWSDERNYIRDNTFHIEEDIVFQYIDYYNQITIPAGTYQFDRFKGGYVVFFD